jgi:hypothetical protein
MKSDRELPSYYRERHAERTKVQATASIRHGDWYSVEVRIHDVSQRGFMAECADPVGIGSYVALDVPGIGTVRAQVRWQIGGRMGGMFLDPISLNRCEWTAVKTAPPSEAA